MVLTEILFYAFAAILLLASMRVVTARQPVHAVLYLVLAFFTSAVIWMLLEAEFLAVALVLVYVGAVMVLFLFVVMMLDLDLAALGQQTRRHLPVALLVAIAMFAELVALLSSDRLATDRFGPLVPRAADHSNTQEIGRALFTEYLYAFEVAGAILLVAIIAAILLTLRHRSDSRRVDPAMQVQARAADRVRIVRMPAEPRS